MSGNKCCEGAARAKYEVRCCAGMHRVSLGAQLIRR